MNPVVEWGKDHWVLVLAGWGLVSVAVGLLMGAWFKGDKTDRF